MQADARKPLTDDEPWPGPAYYEESGRRWFRGRDREAATLDELLGRAAVVTLYGGSGLGKTSLLLAGLFPRLRARGCFPVIVRLDALHGEMPVQELVFAAMAAQAQEHRVELPPRRDGESLWEYLHRRNLEIWSADNRLLVPVLVLDQFEYLFVRGEQRPPDFLQRELADLGQLIENRIPAALGEGPAERRDALDLLAQRYQVLLSFREDFLPQLRSWSRQVPSLNRNFARLEPMTLADAERAIAEAGHAVIEPGLAPDIAAFVAGDAATPESTVEPVLMSMFCSRLNDQRRARGAARIDRTLLQAAGGDILESYYLGALGDPEVAGPPDAQAFIENHLVHGERFRGDFPLAAALDDGLLTRAQLDVLTVRHRLLRVAPHPDTPRIELIHDRLVPVVVRFREQRRLHEAERHAAQQQRRAARLRTQLVVSVVLLVVSVVTGAWGWIATRQARAERAERVRSQQMADVATGALQLATGRQGLRGDGGDPAVEALLRSLAAYRLVQDADDGQARPTRAAALAAIGAGVTRFAPVDRLMPFDGWRPTPALAYGPDGRRLAVGGDDGKVHLFDTATWRERAVLDCGVAGEQVWALAFDAGGGRLLAGHVRRDGADPGRQAVCLFDTETGRRLWQREEVPERRRGAGVYSVRLAEVRGQRLALAAGSDGRLRAWSADDGSPHDLGLAPRPEGEEMVALASADGQWLAASSGDGRLHLLDLARPGARWQEWMAHEATIQHLAFAVGDDGKTVLLSTGDDGHVQAWDPARRCATARSARLPARLYGLASAGSTVSAAGADGMVRLMNLNSGTCMAGPGVRPATARGVEAWHEGDLPGHHEPVLAVAFSPDARRMASTGGDGSLRIWWPKAPGFSRVALDGAGWTPRQVAISDDRRWIAVGNGDGTVALWSWDPEADRRGTPRAQEVHRFQLRGAPVGLAFAGQPAQLVAADGDGQLVVAEVGPTPTHRVLKDTGRGLTAMAIDADGGRVALGRADGSVQLLQWPSLAPLQQWPAEPGSHVGLLQFTGEPSALAFTRVDAKDSSILQVAAIGPARPPCSIATGVEPALALASSRGRWLMVATREGLRDHRPGAGWGRDGCPADAVTLVRRLPVASTRMHLSAVAASDRGELTLVGGENGLLQIWDLDGKEALQLAGGLPGLGGTAVDAVAVARDGSLFVTASAQNLLVWPGPRRWPDLVCTKLGRNMDEAQWREWVSPDLAYRRQCPELPAPDNATR